MDVITSVLLAILLLLVFAVYFQRHRSFQYFKERNLSTPPFNFFFGNLLTLWSKRALACQLQEWTKKYGKIYGIFSGCSPIFIVSDVNFLEQVFIKQFSHFASHNTDPYEHATKRSRQGLLMSSGETWRRQKQIVNPIITTSIPKLNPVFNQCIAEMLQSLQTLSLDGNNEIDVYPIYKKAFWDLMCRSFGVDTTLEKEETDELLYTFDRFFHRTENANYWALKACEMFPSFDTVFLRLNEIYNDIGRFISDLICSKPSKSLWEGFALYRLKDQMYDIFSKRWNDPNYSHQQNEERNDLLLMMSKFLQFQRTEDAGKVAENIPKQKQQRYIGPHEIVDNAFLMIGALYAGAPALMAFLCHTLATHPDVQQKLQDEIEQYLSLTESETLDGNTVSKMPYLDLVLREILRMYPIATQDVNRKCLKETTINGIHITKGAVVRVDVLSVHYDPDLWGPEDPNIFCPERHASRKRHPLSLLFFGAGPKCCPGIEFTEVTVKMMLVGLVRQFNIAPCESHNAGLHIKETVGHLPAEAWIKLISRL